MRKGGLELIACGANVPFEEREIFFGPLTQHTDSHVALIPDFIANCGMARAFSYLMLENSDLSEEAIFADTSLCIENALREVHAVNASPRNITASAFEVALKKIDSAPDTPVTTVAEMDRIANPNRSWKASPLEKTM